MRILSPTLGSPAWRVLHLEDEPPEHLALEAAGLTCKQPCRTGVNKDLTLKRCTQKFHVYQATGNKQSLDRSLGQTYLLVSETCGVGWVGVCVWVCVCVCVCVKLTLGTQIVATIMFGSPSASVAGTAGAIRLLTPRPSPA